MFIHSVPNVSRVLRFEGCGVSQLMCKQAGAVEGETDPPGLASRCLNLPLRYFDLPYMIFLFSLLSKLFISYYFIFLPLLPMMCNCLTVSIFLFQYEKEVSNPWSNGPYALIDVLPSQVPLYSKKGPSKVSDRIRILIY